MITKTNLDPHQLPSSLPSSRPSLVALVWVLLVAGLFLATDAQAYVRYCKLDFAGRDVEIDINKDVFEKYGIDPYELRLALARAGREWYNRVGLPYRIKVNGTYTTATQPTSGHILILGSEAQNTGALADAVPECPDGNTIRFFVRNWQYAPAFRQNSRSGGTKTAGAVTMSFYQVAVHEIGHVLGMDHASGDSIMQGNPIPFGLAWDDINGMRSGTCSTTGTDSGGNSITCANCTLISGTTYDCGFGVATGKTMHAMYSNNDGTSWSEDHAYFIAPGAATNIEASHTFGYNNSGSGSPKYGIAYVRATTAGDDKVRVISGSGSTWPSDVDTGGVSTFGPAIAYGNTGSGNNTGFWVVAYVDRNSSPSNLLKYTITQDPSGTWSTPATVNVGSQDQRAVGRPYLTYSPSSGFFVLAWADENSAQITTATGYPASGAIAWSNRTVTGGLDFTGGAVACVAGTGTPSGVGDCLMAWPHPGQDFPIMSARAWTDPTFSNIKVSPAKRAATDSTISGLGVALKPNASSGGAALAMLAARALGNPWNWMVSSKSTTSQLTAWPSAAAPTGGATGLWSGVSMAYSPYWTEWSSVYSR